MIEDQKILELLTITMEECGEVIQECAKIQRFGLQNNEDRLQSEVGDLMCMIELLEEYNLIDMDAVKIASYHKRNKLKKWSDLDV